MEKKLDGNYTRKLSAVLNKSWRQHPTKLQLYGHLLPIKKPIQVRRTRHAGPCWKCQDKLISDILQWTPSHGRAKVGWPAISYIQQPCADTWCSLKDLPEATDDIDGGRERIRKIRASSGIWWWWSWWWSWFEFIVFSFPRLDIIARPKNPINPTTYLARERERDRQTDRRNTVFLSNINVKWNAISLVQVFNLRR